MTIRHRITLLIVLMFVALAAIGGYAVYQTRRSATDVHQVTAGVVPSALASADLVSFVKDVQIATMTLVYSPDANMVSQAQADLQKRKVALQQALGEQAKSAASVAQKGLIAQANESLDNYYGAIDETAKMKAAGKNELAQAFLFANVAQYRDEMEGIVDALRVEKNREKDSAISSLNALLASTTTTIAFVTGIVIVLLTSIGYLLYRQIARPLGRMQAMMSEIAANQDFTRRVPVGRMDEIGHSIVAFNDMIGKIEESNAQLERKTADIQAMLQNMQQGILTVIDGALVHAEYSVYLEAIFETDDIAGRSLMDLVFADTDLGADALSQVDAAMHACLNEDSINFTFNQHLLVNEITKRMPDGRAKILDLSWSAITDETDTIVRLMLCVRDVTELRQLAEQAGEQRRQLEMIGEILAIDEEKFDRFVESAAGFVRENEHIIRKHARADNAAIAALFRNMHTIKGNARTYNLQHLTDIAHETEQRYQTMRQLESEAEWDQQGLIAELNRVQDAIDSYSRISETNLRRSAGSRHDSGRYLMVERALIRESLALLDKAESHDLPALLDMRASLTQTLRALGTEGVSEALASVVDSLPSLASQLGKAAPVVHVADHGYRLSGEAASFVNSAFMHLLRNSLDHGIEAADSRLSAGKPAAGRIDIDVQLNDDMLQIILSDDGRGLALSRIRGIAVERGFIAAGEPVSDDALAELIFRAGFSTAQTVTEVSGRGVGMDAVRDLLGRAEARIAMRFVDEQRGAPFRQFETVVSLPRRYVVGGASAVRSIEKMDEAVSAS